MRRTSSGRHFPAKYANVVPESTITRSDDIRAAEELKESTKHENISRVTDYIKHSGYDTPFDFIMEFLEFPPRDYVKAV